MHLIHSQPCCVRLHSRFGHNLLEIRVRMCVHFSTERIQWAMSHEYITLNNVPSGTVSALLLTR